MDKEELERLEAEWDSVPDMCIDFDMFCESMSRKDPKKYAKLLFNLPMRQANSIPAGTWIRVSSVEGGSAIFITLTGVDRVVLDFIAFCDPPAGIVIYGTGEKIL